MMSLQRNREQAEAVVLEKVLEKQPRTLSELVGLTIDQLIEDLITLEGSTDYALPELSLEDLYEEQAI